MFHLQELCFPKSHGHPSPILKVREMENKKGNSMLDRVVANSLLMPSLKMILLNSILYVRELEKAIFQNPLTIGFLCGSTNGRYSHTSRRWEGEGAIFLVPDSGNGRGR